MGGPSPAPQGGTGPAMSPSPMAGHGAQSVQGVKLALEMLQKAMVGLDMGSELHTAVLKSITDISKHLDSGSADKSGMIQQLVALARGAQTQPQPQAAAMQQMFPPAGGGAPPPPGA